MTKLYFAFLLSACILINAQVNSVKSNDESLEFKDPCTRIRCNENEICIARDEISASCVSRDQVQTSNILVRRDSSSHGTCGDIECRFGECEVLNSSSFACHCYKGVSGLNCNTLDTTGLPCSSNPCYGDSVCINLDGNAVCVCEAGRTGPECKDHLSPCQCKNGGACFQKNPGVFRCRCPLGFGGHLCQYLLHESCQESGCLNGGICTSSGCKCLSRYTGPQCEIEVTQEEVTSTTSTRKNPIRLNSNINICVPDICLNGGSCIQLGENLGICICSRGYFGQYCQNSKEKPVKVEATTQNAQENNKQNVTLPKLKCPSSIPNPCINGICYYTEETSQISCSCTQTYFGPFCENRTSFCLSKPCKNGGTCNQSMDDQYSGICVCPDGFTGSQCEIGLKCDPNPCKNNQPCIVHNNQPRCFCRTPYLPPLCD